MTTGEFAGDQLRLLVERIERLIDEKKGISDDIRDVFSEAKSTGFDVPTMREMIKLRKMEKHDRDTRQAMVKLYGEQLGLGF